MFATDLARRIRFGIYEDDVDTGVSTYENPEDYYVLSMPLCRGNVKLESDTGTIHDGDVRPGMLRVQAPGERIRVTRRSPPEAATVSIPGPDFRAIADEQGYVGGSYTLSQVEPILRPSYQIERLSSSLISSFELEVRHRQLFVEGVALSLLSVLLGPRNDSDPAGPRGKTGLSDAQLARSLDYADARISERLDLKDWAAVLDMSTSEFARRFRQKTRIAPYAWFMHWRIDRAKLLLARRDLSMVEVAFEVGFCSQSHFTEAFRRRVGLSPGRWRAENRRWDRDSLKMSKATLGTRA